MASVTGVGESATDKNIQPVTVLAMIATATRSDLLNSIPECSPGR